VKSLNDRYVQSHSNTHETFADLIFCALIVLVLFVMMLAVEVSQRVRSSIPAIPEVPAVEDVEAMSAEEVAELSKQLKQQESELDKLREQMVKQSAALSGEQRFTGAREPASFSIAYDYQDEKFYFVAAKDVEHADRAQSGESPFEFLVRKRTELRLIAARALRSQRGYTKEEATQLYSAFSKYRQINPDEDGFSVSEEQVGISYHTQLCAMVAGEDSISDVQEARVVREILEVYQQPGPTLENMYPVVQVTVNEENQTVEVNGVVLLPVQLRDLLLSLGGRGAMIDLLGMNGSAPGWLREQVLVPAGYIGNVPKLP
jgi:hypothetical protein